MMKKLLFTLTTLLLNITTNCYCSAATDLTYTAAIVEFQSIEITPSISFDELCTKNVEKYIELLENTKQSLDIVVFPEGTITTLKAIYNREVLIDISTTVPAINNASNPCETQNFPDYINRISCAARKYNTYIVINTIEKAKCVDDEERDHENCSEEWNLYNTNIVFNRAGTIIAKYRKINLFNEPFHCRTKTPEHVTFDTDFGVKFGTFICFDVVFEEPSLELIRQGVKHFVYPTMWFSEGPFLTALQAQHMWATVHDVVFLASNANNPQLGSGGSGIYRGARGNSEMMVIGNGGTRIIVSEIHKNMDDIIADSTDDTTEEIDRKGAEMDNFLLHLHSLNIYKSHEIQGNLDTTLCDGDFCCHFKIETENEPAKSANYYRYRAFVYSGVRAFSQETSGAMEICAAVFCKNDTQESCAQRIAPYSSIEWPTSFNKIEITGTFDHNKRKIQFPNTLLSSVEPMQAKNYEWSTTDLDGERIEGKLKLLTPQKRLLTFGIIGRDYSKDGLKPNVQQQDKIEL